MSELHNFYAQIIRKKKKGRKTVKAGEEQDSTSKYAVTFFCWLALSPDRQNHSVDGSAVCLMITLSLVSSCHDLGVGTFIMD